MPRHQLGPVHLRGLHHLVVVVHHVAVDPDRRARKVWRRRVAGHEVLVVAAVHAAVLGHVVHVPGRLVAVNLQVVVLGLVLRQVRLPLVESDYCIKENMKLKNDNYYLPV